ncbi:SHOCT domain-containing protein [Nocardiopsis changdeensis]|uniref:SHOCT domain-containing protein n=1 Tax=Nocardiopsis changdeensis TaxID=2831969 RepID=UPI0021B10838|nr:SHOCT domain-containing protein [Nocardiopsis changdeensis]
MGGRTAALRTPGSTHVLPAARRRRTGRVRPHPPPRRRTAPWAAGPRPAPPEYEARRTLADRFARGDITVEEFMERASALNWNPGHDDTKK